MRGERSWIERVSPDAPPVPPLREPTTDPTKCTRSFAGRYAVSGRVNTTGNNTGRLEVVCGPMFAGKTTELIRRLNAAAGAGLHTQAWKPVHDTRYGGRGLISHDGAEWGATSMTLGEVATHALIATGVVAIDEAHFFGDALADPVVRMVERGVRVIVGGVERDHRGCAFPPFPRLLIEADEVVKLHARCAVCGGPAVHSQRMVPGDEPVVVGGAEAYQARCRVCFEGARQARG